MQAFYAALRQSWKALFHWPTGSQWRSAVILALPILIIMALLGYAGGWVGFEPVTDLRSILLTAAIVFVLPAFVEEFVFRGVLLSWFASWSQRWGNWLSIALFVAWHPFQALTFGPPWSAIFLQPSFLIVTFLLGIILTHIRIVSQSLWPVILIHWLLVLGWKTVFAGPVT